MQENRGADSERRTTRGSTIIKSLTRENWFEPTASKNVGVSPKRSFSAMIRSCNDKNKEGENKLDEKKTRLQHEGTLQQQPSTTGVKLGTITSEASIMADTSATVA
jgi:hypothetical protein